MGNGKKKLIDGKQVQPISVHDLAFPGRVDVVSKTAEYRIRTPLQFRLETETTGDNDHSLTSTKCSYSLCIFPLLLCQLQTSHLATPFLLGKEPGMQRKSVLVVLNFASSSSVRQMQAKQPSYARCAMRSQMRSQSYTMPKETRSYTRPDRSYRNQPKYVLRLLQS